MAGALVPAIFVGVLEQSLPDAGNSRFPEEQGALG
jgi:hypothetical protein